MIKSIEFRKKDQQLFLLFWKKFEHRVDRLKNVYIKNIDESIILSYEKSNDAHISDKLIRFWLADSMISFYKERYLLNMLKIPKLSDLSIEVIVKALTVFDKVSDVNLLMQQIKGKNDINTHSFYLFKMNDFRHRWQEVCDLIHINFQVLSNKDIMLEMMRYLLMVTETLESVVNLYLEDDFLVMKGQDGAVLVDPISTKTEKCSIRAIVELISLAPKKIQVQYNKTLTPDFTNFLNDLFPSKVVYCT